MARSYSMPRTTKGLSSPDRDDLFFPCSHYGRGAIHRTPVHSKTPPFFLVLTPMMMLDDLFILCSVDNRGPGSCPPSCNREIVSVHFNPPLRLRHKPPAHLTFLAGKSAERIELSAVYGTLLESNMRVHIIYEISIHFLKIG